MGLGYAFKHAFNGDFANAFNGLFVSDSLLAAQDATGDTLSKKIAQQQAAGLVSADEANLLYAGLSPNTDSSLYWTQSGPSPAQVFNQTLEERASAIGQFGSDATNKILGLGFKIIPWQVYAIALVLVMIWLYPIWKPFAATLIKRK